jgi:hypothetical protein
METASRSFQIRTVILVAFVFIYALVALPVSTAVYPDYWPNYENPLLLLWGPYLFLFHGVNDEIYVRFIFVCLPFFGMIAAVCYSTKMKYFLLFGGIALLYYILSGYAIWAFLPEIVDPEAMNF